MIEGVSYEAALVKLRAAIVEREQFLERLTALRTSLKKLESCSFDKRWPRSRALRRRIWCS